MSGTSLKEPNPIDWDAYNPGSKFQVPPPAKGVDGKYVVYHAQLPTTIAAEADDDGYRRYLLDPITLVKNGQGIDGYTIRFTRASVKAFTGKDGKAVNASQAGNVLKAAQVAAKPQKTAEYDAAFNLIKGKIVPVTVDWYAKNKDTGEQVRGYENFPVDPDRPGQRKAILKAGDTYTDAQGNTQTVKAEVLFANAVVKRFIDPTRKQNQ